MRCKKGFATAFLAVIAAAFLITMLAALETASSYAGKGISECICASAGRSVLSEYQKTLFDEYGLFALYASCSSIKNKLALYIQGSLPPDAFIVKIYLNDIDIDLEPYYFEILSVSEQIKKSYISIDEYILSVFNYCGSEKKTEEHSKYGVETILCGEKSDEESLQIVKRRLFAVRLAVRILENESSDPGEYLQTLLHAFIPGFVDEIIDMSEDFVKASQQAESDVNILLSGDSLSVNGTYAFDLNSYENYLRLFLALVPAETKIQNIMKQIEKEMYEFHSLDFSFDDYVYGFDMYACFTRKNLSSIGPLKKNRTVFKSFIYQ